MNRAEFRISTSDGIVYLEQDAGRVAYTPDDATQVAQDIASAVATARATDASLEYTAESATVNVSVDEEENSVYIDQHSGAVEYEPAAAAAVARDIRAAVDSIADPDQLPADDD